MFTPTNRSMTTTPAVRLRSRRPWSARPRLRRFLPRVDLMEDRTLLSTLTVTNNHDSGSGSLAPRSRLPRAVTSSIFLPSSRVRRSRCRAANCSSPLA